MIKYVKVKPEKTIPYSIEQVAAMFLCPYKYLSDYVLNPSPVVTGSFLIQKYLENILIENTWRKLQNMPQKLSSVVFQEAQCLKQYFTFFRDTEILDIQRRVENYVMSNVLCGKEDSNIVRPLDQIHMQLRKTFGDAWFKEDLQDAPDGHPYEMFDRMVKIKDGMKIYSIHRVTKTEDEQLIQGMLKYINNNDTNMERVGEWCTYCSNKNICLAPYAAGKN